jgi:hypothetical protein
MLGSIAFLVASKWLTNCPVFLKSVCTTHNAISDADRKNIIFVATTWRLREVVSVKVVVKRLSSSRCYIVIPAFLAKE